MDLHTEGAIPDDAQAMESLTKSADFAKENEYKFQTDSGSVSSLDLVDTVEQIDKTTKQIGCAMGPISGSSSPQNLRCGIFATQNLPAKQANEIQPTSNVLPLLEYDEETSSNKHPQRKNEDFPQEEKEHMNHHHPSNLKVQKSYTTRLIEYARHISFNEQKSSQSSKIASQTLPGIAEYMEPQYETFFCPLSKKTMEDPVTIESGQTFERSAIIDWFEKCDEDGTPLICPCTMVKLNSRKLNTNVALRTTIEQWRERNRVARLKLAQAALLLGSSDDMIMEALKELQTIWKLRRNREQFHKLKMIPLLAQFVGHRNMSVRCGTLETLQMMADKDEEKELIGQTSVISSAVMLISNGSPIEQLAAVSLFLDLSDSNVSLCEKIGSIPGSILLLISIYNHGDPLLAEKANDTLRNLVKCSRNIKIMAENGLLNPLLSNLTEGPEDMQAEMACYLSEVMLSNDSKSYVAERSASTLIQMAQNGSRSVSKYALSALVQISSFHPSSKILIEEGVLPVLVDHLFTKGENNVMEIKELSSMVLVNILESKPNLEINKVDDQGHNMVSDYIIYNLIQMIKGSSAELIKNLISIILCLSELPKAVKSIRSATKDPETVHFLVELINYPQEELVIASTNFLIFLSTHIGNTISEKLCRTYGQPEKLIDAINTDQVTELASVSANILTKLPAQNLAFNMILAQRGTLTIALKRLNEIKSGEIKASRFLGSFVEGLVGILVRFTFSLQDREILSLVMLHDLSVVFAELLTRPGSDEVQMLSAIGLENLSLASIGLSQVPKASKKKKSKGVLTILRKPKLKQIDCKQCPIHRGVCSSKTTFCLLESRALENLLACLDHQNVGVIKASLSAVCTILDDRVDSYMGVVALSKLSAIQHVLNLLKDHKDMVVWQKSFWVIEKFLVNAQGMNFIVNDKVLPVTLVTAFQHGDTSTQQIAERLLRHLNKMPIFSRALSL